MVDTKCILFGSILLIITVKSVSAGEYCTDHDSSWPVDDSNTFWCDTECCGTYYNRYCCLNVSTYLTTAAIIGIVIGSLALLAGVVGTIIAIYCCLRGRRAQRGVVYGGNTGTAPGFPLTTVASGGHGVTVQTASPVPTYPQGAYPQTGYPQGQPAAGEKPRQY